jgi:hypothetical protein
MPRSFQEIQSQWTPFDEYRVTITLNSIAGGVPKNKNIIRGWIDSTNKEKSEEERQKLVEATMGALPDLSEEKEAKSWVGFKADNKGLFVEGRQVKAMLKEAANIIKDRCPNGSKDAIEEDDVVKKKKDLPAYGVRNLKSKVADHVFVVEDRIYLGKATPDELEERPVHAMTPQGPRSSLKRTDVVHGATVSFTLRRLADEAVPEETLFAILAFAQHIGLGADRSQGHGTFRDVEVEKITKAQYRAA